VKFECVIFDMDGTLTEPWLDFAAIRAELGVAPDGDILAALEEMTPARRIEAMRTLLAHESAAAREAPLTEGAHETLARIREAGLATALLTRSSREAMETVLERFAIAFDLTWCRDNGPIKPSPISIKVACRKLGTTPERTACVGDWVFDLQAANAAGCVSVLLARGPRPDFADQADHVIGHLSELNAILGT